MSSKRILYVEDDLLMRRVFEKLFHLHGYDIEFIQNGEDALTRFRESSVKPDAILLDIMIPKVDGIEVLKAIKENPIYSTIPVVILSNVGGDKDAARARALGANHYFIKSEHEPEEIVTAVRELIGE